MTLVTLPPGAKGFDVDSVVSAPNAKAMAQLGFSFCARYIRRENAAASDLSVAEIGDLHAANLSVFPVQHVASESSWTPSAALGEQYGLTAAHACQELDLPPGVCCAVDLEGVAPGTAPTIVIAYLRAWWAAVNAVGMVPMLYDGWHGILTPQQRYDLPFVRYWGALSQDADQIVAVRGNCLHQRYAATVEDPLDLGIDVNTVVRDAKGGLPTAFGA